MTIRFSYIPQDDFSLEQIETKLKKLMEEDATPLFEAHLSVEAQPGREDEAVSAALGALQKIVPPLSHAWWRTRGGVQVSVSDQPGAYCLNSLEFKPS